MGLTLCFDSGNKNSLRHYIFLFIFFEGGGLLTCIRYNWYDNYMNVEKQKAVRYNLLFYLH